MNVTALLSHTYPYALPHPTLPASLLSPSHQARAESDVTVLNAFLQKKEHLQGLSLSYLLQNARELPPALRYPLSDLAGSYFHHSLFFASFTEARCRLPKELSVLFGTPASFAQTVFEIALQYRSCGWLWVAKHRRSGDIRLLFLRNNDVPDLQVFSPLLCIDLWEHAHWERYPCDLQAYLQALLPYAAWDAISERELTLRKEA